MAFTRSIKVRFGDEDHAGIVYYPRFFDWFHQVFEDFFEEIGMSYQRVLDEDHAGWPSVHAEADYASPARFGDVLAFALSVERIGTSSTTFAYRVTNEHESRLVATGRVTCACVDMRTFRAQPIPERYRALFEKHLTEAKEARSRASPAGGSWRSLPACPTIGDRRA